ncbi:MAG: hypothetical protein M9944_04190 [Rhizobiaceae bacterium]|nr:hypothetical protein [Rhizobiaceae bacterium]
MDLPLRLAMVLACVTGTATTALAADRWEEAAGGAVAILPTPVEPKGISGGTLYCVEQKWGFLFRTDGEVGSPDALKIGVEGQSFTLPVEAKSGSLHVLVPTEMLNPLKAGVRMRVSVASEPPLVATFNLRGSKKVIEAITPRCSPIDMSAYQEVSLLEEGPSVDAATDLFGEEIELFRQATKKQPSIAAAQFETDEGRKLLFGSLCGSTYYYGSSGCTLSGWRESGEGDWQQIYSSEGARIYIDKARMDSGWPGLVTVAMVNGVEAIHWSWRDDVYVAVDDGMMAEDETIEKPKSAQ